MNDLVKQMLDFSKTSDMAGFAMFLIVMGAMYYVANMLVGIFKWIAIAIKGYPPKGTKLGDDIN